MDLGKAFIMASDEMKKASNAMRNFTKIYAASRGTHNFYGAQHKSPGSSGKRKRQMRALESLSSKYYLNEREMREKRILKTKLGISD